MKRLFTVVLVVGGFLLSFAANAILIGDRTTFEASLDSIIIDGYENAGYVFNQTDADMSSVLGETQYTTTGFTNWNLVPGSSGDQYYCAGCNGSFQLDFTGTSVSGASGVFGVGFDFFNQIEPLYNAFVTYGDGATENILLDQVSFSSGMQFFGITSDSLISTIDFGLAGGGTTTSGSFGLDDLTIGNSAVNVPEPSILALLGLGLAGLIFSRKKKV